MAITISGSGIVEANLADNAVTLAKMASGTDGEILTYDASGNPVAVSVGTDGQVLTSTGAGSPPAFETAAGGGKVLQVLEVNTGSELMVSSTYNSTGGYVTITPSATTSKILVIANSPRVYNNAVERVEAAIYRGTSGEGSGSSLNQARIANGGGSGASHSTGTIMWLDEPASTSALTYTVMHRNENNSTLVGWCDGGGGFTPSLMVMEIGA